ncbi:MAG: hypothetical protein U1E15_09480 [Hyphomicrobiales bacterium]
MTELLQRAFEKLNAMPDEQQDWIARYIMRVTGEVRAGENIPPDVLDGVMAGLAEADAGQFLPAQEMKAYFDRHLK